MGISIWQLVIVLVIVILLFGTKKLKNMGGDLGGAIKSFKKAVKDGDTTSADKEADDKGTEKLTEQDAGRVIDGEVTSKESSSSSQNKDNA